jgi:hypothetical protein
MPHTTPASALFSHQILVLFYDGIDLLGRGGEGIMRCGVKRNEAGKKGKVTLGKFPSRQGGTSKGSSFAFPMMRLNMLVVVLAPSLGPFFLFFLPMITPWEMLLLVLWLWTCASPRPMKGFSNPPHIILAYNIRPVRGSRKLEEHQED